MSHKEGRLKAAKRRYEEDDVVASKRTRLESAEAPAPKPCPNSKAKNSAANRLTALRSSLYDSVKSNSEKGKTVKVCKSISTAEAQTTNKLSQTTSTRQVKKYSNVKDLKVSTFCPNPSKITRNACRNYSSTSDDNTIIIIDNSPSPRKQESISSPFDILSRNKRTVKRSSSSNLLEDFIVISEDDSSRHESPLSVNARLKRISSTLSSTSKAKTLTPNSVEQLNRSVVHDGASRGVNIPRANLFKDQKHDNAEVRKAADLQSSFYTPSKSQTYVPYNEKKANFFEGVKSLVSEDTLPDKSTNNRSLGTRESLKTNGLIDFEKAAQNPKTNQTETDLSNENKAKSSVADRLTNIRSGKVPFKRTSTLVNEENPENSVALVSEADSVLKCKDISKSSLIKNWIDSVFPQACNNQSMSDSMQANVNDTIFGRSVLLNESQADESMDWDATPEPSNNQLPPMPFPAERKQDIICLVTDTNVFLHDLPKVQELLNFKIAGSQNFIIYIPWMVLKELDHIKDQSSRNSFLKSQALTAQKLINKALVESNSKVLGQSVNDVCQQMDLGKDPDDKILACCLQAKNKFNTVILLSNDINLRNKALTNDLKAYSPKEIVAKLKCSKSVKIKVKLQGLLSQIVFQCCKEAYGDACLKMEMLQNCPWSFEGCLNRFKRYWSPVFRQLLLKQCLKTIDELISITSRGNVVDSNSEEFDKFKSKVKEFLFFLQDIEKYNAAVKKLHSEMDSIVEDECIL